MILSRFFAKTQQKFKKQQKNTIKMCKKHQFLQFFVIGLRTWKNWLLNIK